MGEVSLIWGKLNWEKQIYANLSSKMHDIWERVIVLSIQMKYVNIKGNMNNDLKKIFLSMMYFVMCDLTTVFG